MLTFTPAADRHRPFIAAAQRETATLSYGRAPTSVEVAALESRVAEALANPGSQICVAEFAGAPVAYYWLGHRNPNLAFLLDIFVVPSCRGEGLGRMVLDHAMSQARAWGAPEIRLAVAGRNSAAMRLFDASGFAAGDSEEREGHVWYELRRPLQGAPSNTPRPY